MPHELRTAHRENDKAVMQAYGFADSIIRAYIESDDESEIVPKLMKMYQQLTAGK